MQGTDARFIRSFVETLTRTERQLLMLHYAEALTAAEIAVVLGMAEPSVDTMLDNLRERARTGLSALALA